MTYTCAKCGVSEEAETMGNLWYHLQTCRHDVKFCCKFHLMEWLRSGLDGVLIVGGYQPSPDEIQRMHE